MTINNRHPLSLPDDLPLQPYDLSLVDGGRLMPLIDALSKRLLQWQALEINQKRSLSPPRLGLFGGLGQGKSSVMLAVMQSLQDSYKSQSSLSWNRWQWMFGSTVVRFDVSYFKADDLEWKFLTAVLWRRILINALWMLPLLAILATLIFGAMTIGLEWNLRKWMQLDLTTAFRWLWGTVSAHWSWLLPIVSVVIAIGLRAVKVYGKVNLGVGLFVGQRDLLTQTLARFFCAMPSVVLVDDLDRARVEQQRAFLRAMMRFSDCMGFALVVSLDETELLTSPANPDAPQELLRKTIHHEYRVPDRGPEDLTFLAILTAENFAQRNQEAYPELAIQLRHSLWMTDWVRVLLLLPPPVSPRMVKRILADTLVAASLRFDKSWQNVVPLLRLQVLYLLAPALRNDPQSLCTVMEFNRVSGFVVLLEKCHPGDSEKQRRANAIIMFSRTRMMQPRLGEGWFGLIMSMPAKDLGNNSNQQNPTPPLLDLKSWHFFERRNNQCSALVVPILRLFRESIQHAAHGYESPMFAFLRKTPDPGHNSDKTEFSKVVTLIPWGRAPQDQWAFSEVDLPSGWLNDDAINSVIGTTLLSVSVWLVWVSAMVAGDTTMRNQLYHSAKIWIDNHVAVNERAFYFFALLRERCADEEYWGQMQPLERTSLVEHAAQQTNLVTLLALTSQDFSLAVKHLPATGRDERAMARWLHSVTHGVTSSQSNAIQTIFAVAKNGSLATTDLASVWPPVISESHDSTAWHRILGIHLKFWAMLDWKSESPAVPYTLHNAFVRAWRILLPEHRLSLLGTLSCPRGVIEHGSIERLFAWIVQPNEEQQEWFFSESESRLLEHDTWVKDLKPAERIVGFLSHLIQQGKLNANSVLFIGIDGIALLNTVASILFNNRDVKKSVVSIESNTEFWIELFKKWKLEFNSNDITYLMMRQVIEPRIDSNQIFDALGWKETSPSL